MNTLNNSSRTSIVKSTSSGCLGLPSQSGRVMRLSSASEEDHFSSISNKFNADNLKCRLVSALSDEDTSCPASKLAASTIDLLDDDSQEVDKQTITSGNTYIPTYDDALNRYCKVNKNAHMSNASSNPTIASTRSNIQSSSLDVFGSLRKTDKSLLRLSKSSESPLKSRKNISEDEEEEDEERDNLHFEASFETDKQGGWGFDLALLSFPDLDLQFCIPSHPHALLKFPNSSVDSALTFYVIDSKQTTEIIRFTTSSIKRIQYGKWNKIFAYMDIFFSTIPYAFATLGIELQENTRWTNFRCIISFDKERLTYENFEKCVQKLSCNKCEKKTDLEYQAFQLSESDSSLDFPDVPFSSKRSRALHAGTQLVYRNLRSSTASGSSYRKGSLAGDAEVGLVPHIPSKGSLLFVFPEGARDAVSITTVELARLQPGIYLNDNIIDFDLRRLYLNLPPAIQDRILVFNCFFYKKLSQPRLRNAEETAYNQVKAFVANVDIFSKDLIIIPINE